CAVRSISSHPASCRDCLVDSSSISGQLRGSESVAAEADVAPAPNTKPVASMANATQRRTTRRLELCRVVRCGTKCHLGMSSTAAEGVLVQCELEHRRLLNLSATRERTYSVAAARSRTSSR